jgi:hypothetical protein
MAKNISKFYSKAFQNISKLGFWYENIPFGNPKVQT